MRLQLMTWPEVEAYLGRSTGLLLPIGSAEQHGPTGFIGTDALCPELVALTIGERSGVLVAPTLPIGMAQHHLGFPGTVSLRPSTLLALVRDVVTSLARHGFRRFFFINGHGGNIATVNAAFSEIYAEASLGGPMPEDVRCHLANWWEGDGVRAISERSFGDAEGSHATPSELSLSYLRHPEAAARARANTVAAGTADQGTIHTATDFRRRFPDGRIGSDPSLADERIGEELLEAAVAELTGRYETFLAEA